MILSLLLLTAGAAVAGDPSTGSAAFARVPAGARAPAVGGTVDAIETGPGAALANPAGLAQMEAPLQVAAEGGFLALGRSALYAGVAGWATPELPVAIAVFRQGQGDGIEFRRANTLTPDGPPGSAVATTYAGALGLRIFPALDAGVSLRWMTESVSAGGPDPLIEASGFSADAGFLYRPWARITASAVLRDFPGSSLDWTPTGGSDRLARTYDLTGAVDLNPVLVTVGASALGGGYARWRAGAEWDLAPPLTLRLGVDGAHPAAGLGFRTTWRRTVALAWDYAFAQDHSGGAAFAHRFALSVAVVNRKWPTGRLLFPTEEPSPRTGIPEWMEPSRRPPPLFTWPHLAIPTEVGGRPAPRPRPAPAQPLPPAAEPSATTPDQPAPLPVPVPARSATVPR